VPITIRGVGADRRQGGRLKKATETVIVLLACIPALVTALMVVAGLLMIGIGTILELTAPEWAVAWESFTAPLRALFRALS
jgi:hypothetical protein